MTNKDKKRYDEISEKLREMDKAKNTKTELKKLAADTKEQMNTALKFSKDFEKAKQDKVRLDFKAAQNRLDQLEADLNAKLLLMEKYVLIEENITEVLTRSIEYFNSPRGIEDLIFYKNKQQEILNAQAKALYELDKATPKAPLRKAPKY